MSEIVPFFLESEIEIVKLPEGRLPERKSGGAIGYDVYARFIVSQTETDPDESRLRKTIFDFKTVPESASLQERIVRNPGYSKGDEYEWVYELRPGEHALVGVGFVTALPRYMMIWLAPRSGLSMRRITLNNAPGTIDPDYRGEAGVLILNDSDENFVIQHEDRIAQALFCPVFLPAFIIRNSIDELGATNRSGEGFGSTGMRD